MNRDGYILNLAYDITKLHFLKHLNLWPHGFYVVGVLNVLRALGTLVSPHFRTRGQQFSDFTASL